MIPFQQSWGYEQEESIPLPVMAFCLIPADQMQMPFSQTGGFYPAWANPQGFTQSFQGCTQFWQPLPMQQMTQMTQTVSAQYMQAAQMQQLQPMQMASPHPMQQLQPVQQLPLQQSQIMFPAPDVLSDGPWGYARTPEQCCEPQVSNTSVAEVSTAPSEATPRSEEAERVSPAHPKPASAAAARSHTPGRCCEPQVSNTFVAEVSTAPSEATPRSEEAERMSPPHTKPTSASSARRLRRRRAAERKAREEAIDPAHNVGSEGKQHQKPWKQESSEAQLRGRVWALAQDKDGCRLVQKALEKLARKGGREAATIAWELRGHILEAIKHPHGNYVVQKAVAQLSVGSSSFIVHEIRGSAIMVAKHRMGCRTLCRLLEFCSTNPQVGRLVDELMPEISELCCHSFAHHVVESVMEHGEERHKHRIAQTLLRDVMRFADHKNTSYLIEKVLSNCSDENQRAMLYALDLNRIIDLAKTRYGRHVAKTMLQDRRWYTAWGAEKSEQLISPWKSELEADCFGFLFLKDMAKSWR